MRALLRRRPAWGLAALALALAAPMARPAERDGTALDPVAAVKFSQGAIGRSVGEYAFQDRAGRRVMLSSYRGKPLLVSFVYSGCFQVCPVTTKMLTAAVASAQRALGAGSFNVITIGFNQPFDSPEAMAAFARQNGVEDPRWSFLGTDAVTVPGLARDFGFTYYATPKGFDHITQVTVLDGEGTVYRQVYGDTFELQMLIEPVKELLSGQARRAEGLEAIWTKVKLFCTVYDPNTGGYRANYSLFVEIFAGLSMIAAVIGFLVSQRRKGVPLA